MRVTRTTLKSGFILLLILSLLTGCGGRGTTPLASTPAPAVVSLPAITPESLKLVYEDDFGNISSGWFVSSSENRGYSYENGEYRMAAFKDISAWSWGASIERTDFVVEADARDISVTGKSEYGIVFRLNENRDFYAFTISNGNYEVVKHQNEKWDSIRPSTKSPYIKTTGETNHMKVAAVGETIEVYVNGQKLYTLKDAALGQGKVGLLVTGTDGSAAFDNFKLYSFTNAYLVKAGRPPATVSNPTVVPTPPPAPSAIPPTVPVVPATTPIVASLPAITPESLKLIYQDNFGNISSGWPVFSDANVSYSYKEGEYRISLFKDSFFWVTGPSDKLADFVVEVDARDLSTTGKSRYGINFRSTDAGDYDLFLSGDSYQLIKWQNDHWSDIKPWTKSHYIKTGGETNHLRIICLGNIIEVYVNGQKLDTLKDDSFSTGDIALSIAGLNTSAAFDNFKLYSFTDAYLANARRMLAVNAIITTGPAVELAQQTIPTTGGIITLNKPGDALNGLQITVPSGAYKTTTNFTISYQNVRTANTDLTNASPLITIENGGKLSDLPMTMKIPIKLGEDDFPMVFDYDVTTGNMEPIPTIAIDANSITVDVNHFSSKLVLTQKGQYLRGQELLNLKNGFTTKFLPGQDDWKLENRGTFTSPEGNCAGMSVAAMWYFVEKSKGQTNRLSGQYPGRVQAIHEDDREAWRLVSTVQQDINLSKPLWSTIDRPTLIGSTSHGDEVTYKSFQIAMIITGNPQLILMKGKDKLTGKRLESGHAMIAYGFDANGIKVADPNDPGGIGHVIPFKNGILGPYETNTDPQNKNVGTIYDTFFFGARGGSFVSWEKVAAHWDEVTRKTIGNGLFPDYDLKVTDDRMGQYDIGEYEDTATVNSRTVSIQVNSTNALGLRLYRDGAWVNSTPQGTITLDLKNGANLIGVYIQGKPTGTSNWSWADFKWVTITFNASTSETWKANLVGTAKYFGSVVSVNYDITMTIPGSLTAAFQTGQPQVYNGIYNGKGTLNATATIVSQPPPAVSYTLSNYPITNKTAVVSAGVYQGVNFISLVSLSGHICPLASQSTYHPPGQIQTNGLDFTVQSVTANTISGTWSATGNHAGFETGTFTLTKQ